MGVRLRKTGDHSNCDRGPKDLNVVMIDLVPEAGLAYLVESMELIEVDAEPVRHD